MSPRSWPTGRRQLARLARYAAVSAVSTATTLVILGLLVGVVGFSGVWSNVVATALGTIPSFELNRRWVWSQRAADRRLSQVVPFCLLSLAGLLASTLAVRLASDATTLSGRLVHTLSVEAANVAAYGALWLVQFFLCDRVLFRAQRPAIDPAPAAVPERIGPLPETPVLVGAGGQED